MKAFGTALLMTVVLAGPSRADMVTHHSLEWLVSSSDHVVDGEVSAVRPHPRRTDRRLLVLKVRRPRLKGGTPRSFSAQVPGRGPTVGQRVIIFTRTIYAPGSCGPDPRTGKTLLHPQQLVTAMIDGRRNWTVPTRDFRRVQGVKTLRRLIKKMAKTEGVKRSVGLPVPPDSELGGNDRFNTATLIVPRDAETERYVLGLIGSRAAADRVLGAQLLVHYESAANIRTLLKLRDDPAVIGGKDGKTVRWVRASAEATLKRWKVPLP